MESCQKEESSEKAPIRAAHSSKKELREVTRTDGHELPDNLSSLTSHGDILMSERLRSQQKSDPIGNLV